jgi:hypothetical protein
MTSAIGSSSVAAGVIVVLMRVDDVSQRLVRHRLHLRQDRVMIPVNMSSTSTTPSVVTRMATLPPSPLIM